MRLLNIGDYCKRNDNGRRVRVIDVRPTGQHVFYVTEDCQDGHTALVQHEDCRPDTEAPSE